MNYINNIFNKIPFLKPKKINLKQSLQMDKFNCENDPIKYVDLEKGGSEDIYIYINDYENISKLIHLKSRVY
jgi:hypothetical protein